MKQLEYVNLGPANYFPGGEHIHIDPFKTDDEVIKIIKDEIYWH